MVRELTADLGKWVQFEARHFLRESLLGLVIPRIWAPNRDRDELDLEPFLTFLLSNFTHKSQLMFFFPANPIAFSAFRNVIRSSSRINFFVAIALKKYSQSVNYDGQLDNRITELAATVCMCQSIKGQLKKIFQNISL